MKKETRTVVYDEELRIEAYYFRGIVQPFPNHFHNYYVIGFVESGERCLLLLLLSLVIQRYGQPFEECIPECREEIERACAFIEQHYAGHIHLDQICGCCGLSKSTLLRAFTKSKGVTPYSYLQNIRTGAAKKLLEQGRTPLEAAMQTGFSDQSHFTNYFNRFIGITPGGYREIFY